MKKRNKPILLATLLLILVGGAVAMNLDLQPKSEEQIMKEQQERQAQQKASELGEKRTNENNASAAKGAASAFTKRAASVDDAEAGPKGPPTSLKRPSPAAVKPQPNSGMTNGQWYAKEFGYKGDKK